MVKKEILSSSIGKLTNIDFDKLASERRKLGRKVTEENLPWNLYEISRTVEVEDLSKAIRNGHSGLFGDILYFSSDKYTEEQWTEKVEKHIGDEIAPIKRALDYSIEFNNPIQVYYSNENFTIIGWGKIKMALPTDCLGIELYKTYDEVLPSEISNLLLGQENSSENDENLPVYLPDGTQLKNLPKRELESGLEQIKGSIQAQEEELKKGLEEIRNEMYKKEEELKLAMKEKMNELQAKKKEFEKQIFGLDHQLYLLRCLLGDSINILHLRKGTEAPVEQPVVLFQKLRFLDEDLAKIKLLYCYDYDDEKYVEEIFRDDNIVFEQFCPNTKCVVLFRISKDNAYFKRDEEGNSLEKCYYYNGTRIGILVRNGENLYLVWTEDDRIYLKENFIFNPQATISEVKDSKIDTDETIVDDNYTSKANIPWVQFFSRRFLMAILHGLVEYQKIMKFPDKISFLGPGPYVIFSTADNQISDNRFGTLSQFMLARNGLTMEDDYVLPTQAIRGCTSGRSSWGSGHYEDHSRGRGDNNRVRGCSISDEVTKINLVEVPTKSELLVGKYERWDAESKKFFEIPEEELTEVQKATIAEYNKAYPYLFDELGNVKKERIRVGDIQYSLSWESAGKGYVWKDTQTKLRLRGIRKEVILTDRLNETKYYISVSKPEEWNSKRKEGSVVNSRIQIYKDEFINLTYLSSTILSYFIESKQIGNYFGTNYAYAIQYLHKALEFIRDRENNDFIKISAQVRKDVSVLSGIDLVLMDWKFNNRVREITDFQAKRFAKYLGEIKDVEAKSREITNNIDWVKE